MGIGSGIAGMGFGGGEVGLEVVAQGAVARQTVAISPFLTNHRLLLAKTNQPTNHAAIACGKPGQPWQLSPSLVQAKLAGEANQSNP
jgi:hypothetical protein